MHHHEDAWQQSMEDPLGGFHRSHFSLPGIVIATPGRLVAHLQGTPGFSVLGLRFLVGFPALRHKIFCSIHIYALPVFREDLQSAPKL